jgi:hypothetical protein
MSIAEKLTTIAENQQLVYDAGYTKGNEYGYDYGYSDGFTFGVAEGIAQGFADGIEQGYNAGNQWWLDMIATKIYCDSLFAYSNITTFPDIIIQIPITTSASYMFQKMPNLASPVSIYAPVNISYNQTFRETPNLPEITVESGNVEAYWSYAFYKSGVKKITLMNIRKINNADNMFCDCEKLVEIDADLDFTESASVNRIFNMCVALEKVRFVPGAIKKSISFAFSNKLNEDSLQSIIDGLADLTGGTAQTLTLGGASGNNLTQLQKDAISAKNWTLAY